MTLASAGPSAARTQGAAFGGAKGKPEDAAARSKTERPSETSGDYQREGAKPKHLRVSAAARGARETSEKPLRTPARVALCGVLALLTFATFSASSAFAAKSHVPGISFGSPGAAAGDLALTPYTNEATPSNIAVNESSGDVYVADTGNDRVDQFSSAGAFIRAWGWGVESGAAEPQTCTTLSGCQAGLAGSALAQFESARTIAVDNSPGGEGDVYVGEFFKPGEPGVSRIQKFSAAGVLVTSWAEGGQLKEGALTGGHEFVDVTGLTVDPSGDLWAASAPGVFEFTQAGTFLQNTGSHTRSEPPTAIAADAAGDLYLDGVTAITKNDSTGTNLGEVYEAESPPSVGVAVDTAGEFTGELYVAEGATIATVAPGCAPALSPPFCPAAAHLDSSELGQVGGLAVDSQTDVVYVADIANDAIRSFIVEQPGPPTVAAANQSVTAVTSTEATLHGEVGPQSNEGEPATTYRFEYGPCPSFLTCAGAPYPFPSPTGTLPPDFALHQVEATLAGLAPATVYHYRLAAANSHSPEPTPGEVEPTLGSESTFTTQTTGPLALPDSRQWQLVSPPQKLGAKIEKLSSETVTEAAASGDGLTYRANAATEPEPEGFTNEQQLLSIRTASGWTTRDLGIPHANVTGNAQGGGLEYKSFATDLHASVVQPFGEFIPQLSPEASESTAYLHDLSSSCGPSCFRPLVTAKPGFNNVPLGTEFGREQECRPAPGQFTRLGCGPTFEGATDDLSHVVLSSNAPLAPGAAPAALYEWSAGTLAQVSILPGGGSVSATLGGGGDPRGATAQGAISADGDRVIFSTGENGNIYLRDLDRGETVQLDAAKVGCGSCESGAGRFQFASADGSRVFFTDFRRLTADSGAANDEADLYGCRIEVDGEGHLACALTDLTPLTGLEPAAVQGRILGAATDGSHLYLVANSVLSTQPNDRGQSAEPGKCAAGASQSATCNLYLLHNGSFTFITAVTQADETDWSREPTARVPGNGRFLAFSTRASATGYDNRDVSTGEPDQEVHLYDASENHLDCASCNPSGARPSGVTPLFVANRFAATLPPWTGIGFARSRYQPRYLSDSGRLFFNAAGPLAPQDSNGTQDVYQYEPPGVGSCTEADPTFSQQNEGCLGLISSGTSKAESGFLDASETGDDVFFYTTQRLDPSRDVDPARDVYDAHACSTSSPCLPEPPAPPPICQGDACQQPATPPNDATPGSLTFQGAGNELNCPKGKVKKSGKCVKKSKGKKHKNGKKKSGKKVKTSSSRIADRKHGGHR